MNISHLQKALTERVVGEVVVESTVMTLVFLVGVLGNTLVFCATWRSQHLRTISNMFVVGLAVSDILMSIICMPLSLTTLIHGQWIYDSVICYIHGFSVFTLGLASLHMMALVSVNRYFCILKPSKYTRMFNRRRTIIYMILVWLNAFIGSVPPFFFDVGGYSFQPGKAMCLYEFEAYIPYTAYIEIVYIGIPLNLIAFCYLSVFKEVYRSNKVFSIEETNIHELRAHVKEAKITKTLIVVFLGFAICWMPVSVIDYIDAIQGKPALPRQAYMTYGFLVYLSSTINPIIYGISNRSFRHEYMKIFRKFLCGFFCCKNVMLNDNTSINERSRRPTEANGISLKPIRTF